MGIYRGPGGTGDAVNDASSEATLTVQAKDAALVAQAAAEASATSASNSATSATSSASSASSSASAASTSASNASSSASSATFSASAASTSASNASTSATNASNSATSAATSASDAATLYDNFDDRYLGAKTSAPSVDNDGNALITGALYFNSSTSLMKVWSGSAWLDAYASVSGAVTSVTATAPVTSSGGTTPNIALASGYGDTTNPYASKAAKLFLATPNGSSGVPTFRGIAASDVPNLNQNTTGTAANVTGTVAIANGGTGQTAKAAAFNALSPVTSTGDLILGNGSNSNTRLAIGTSGYLLTSNGTTATWAAAPVSLPSQTGYAGKYLTTDGSTASWATVASGGSASNGIFQNATTVNTNETISSGNNGFSVGPMTIASGVAVTVASGQRWVVI